MTRIAACTTRGRLTTATIKKYLRKHMRLSAVDSLLSGGDTNDTLFQETHFKAQNHAGGFGITGSE